MKYNVTIESKEYNPVKRQWENKQFSGEFENKSVRGAKMQAKNFYAIELNTDKEEIDIISVEEIN